MTKWVRTAGLLTIALASIGLGLGLFILVRGDMASTSSAVRPWPFHSTFISIVGSEGDPLRCIAVGEAWAERNQVRIHYSGSGAPDCWEATDGSTIQLLADDQGIWTYNERTRTEGGFAAGDTPIENKDFSPLLTLSGPWCDANFYECRSLGAERIAGTDVIHVTTKEKLSGSVLDFWVEPDSGRVLRYVVSNPSGEISYQYHVTIFDERAPLPERVFDRNPLGEG